MAISGAPLPPGYTQNPDGTITLPNGQIAGSPAGQSNNGAPSPSQTAESTDWFSSHPPPSTFDAPPAPYTGSFDPLAGQPGSYTPTAAPAPYVPIQWTGGDYTTLAKPDWLQQPFTAPTAEQVRATPGYDFTVATGVKAADAGAFASGSGLSGGQAKALTRFGQNLGETYYNSAFNQALAGRQQNVGEFNTDTNNAYRQYQTRYGVFNDTRNANFQAANLNENAWAQGNQFGLQANQQAQNAYSTAAQLTENAQRNRYGAYVDQNNATRQAGLDWWSQLQDQIKNGLTSASIAKPPA